MDDEDDITSDLDNVGEFCFQVNHGQKRKREETSTPSPIQVKKPLLKRRRIKRKRKRKLSCTIPYNVHEIHAAIRWLYQNITNETLLQDYENAHEEQVKKRKEIQQQNSRYFKENGWKYPKQYVHTDEDKYDIIQRFTLGYMPNYDKTAKSDEQIEKEDAKCIPKRKPFRRKLPSIRRLRWLCELIQNTLIWLMSRRFSWGASTKHTLAGWDHYGMDNQTQFHEDVGNLVRAIDVDSFNTDHGHTWEDEGGDLYFMLMKHLKRKAVGILINPKHPYSHASPDDLWWAKPWTYHNLYTLEDELEGMSEIKFPIHSILRIKESDPDGIIHTISGNYLIQVQDQCATARRPFEDFISCWRFSNRSPWKHASDIPGINDQVFKPFEMVVSRIYHNPNFTNHLYSILDKHVEAIDYEKEPTLIKHVEFEPVEWVPLPHTRVYMSGFLPRFGSRQNGMIDLKWFQKTDNVTMERPTDWKGEWPPYCAVDIKTFWHVKKGLIQLKKNGDVERTWPNGRY
jgi:hypothetical protein